jgi:hypothetical protein
MGLGLYVRAARLRKSWWKRLGSDDDLAESLARQVVSAIDEPVLRDLAGVHPADSGLEVYLHPAAERLELIRDGVAVICSAKTSTCGPGYHAYVVELLQRAGSKVGIDWTLDGDYGDETGYWTDRSFERLQEQMAGWLHAVSGSIVKHAAEYQNLMINMPLGFPTLADGGKHTIITPIEPRTAEWFELAARSREEALRLAPGFFPWWNHGQDGEFWRGLGLVWAWGNLSWSPPTSDEERATYQLVLTAFQRAAAAGAGGLPNDEIDEVASLLAADEDTDLPPADSFPMRIGYRRRRLRRPLTGRWQVTLPGYFYHGEENDGGTVVYWYGDRTVRGSSFTVTRRDGRAATAAEMVANMTPPENPDAEVIDERASDPPGWATVEWKDDENGCYWELTGQTGAVNDLCLTTICYEDEADREWAVNTWRTVSRPPAEETD